MKWTEETIESEILKLKRELNIKDNRMPSSTEMRDSSNSGLSRAISLNGGMLHWAEKMDLYLRTSGESNKIWTDDKIHEHIKESIETLRIDKMPTVSELRSIGRGDLANAITKSKLKYSGWAKKLKLETKQSETNKGQNFEKMAIQDLIERFEGSDIKKMTSNYPFDLLFNDSVKIDVKVGMKHNHFGTPSYTFRTAKKYGSCDFYLCYGVDRENKVENIYIIPSFKAQVTTLNITIGGKSKYNKCVDQWDSIIKLANYINKTF